MVTITNRDIRTARRNLEKVAGNRLNATPEEIAEWERIADSKSGNKTGPRPQGMNKFWKERNAHREEIGRAPKQNPLEKGPNIDGVARRAKRTEKKHARGVDIVTTLLTGELSREWQLRSHPEPQKMTPQAERYYNRLKKHFSRLSDMPELTRAALSKTGQSVILQHKWRDAEEGGTLTVSVPCINTRSNGIDRQLSQQECEGIQRVTGLNFQRNIPENKL